MPLQRREATADIAQPIVNGDSSFLGGKRDRTAQCGDRPGVAEPLRRREQLTRPGPRLGRRRIACWLENSAGLSSAAAAWAGFHARSASARSSTAATSAYGPACGGCRPSAGTAPARDRRRPWPVPPTGPAPRPGRPPRCRAAAYSAEASGTASRGRRGSPAATCPSTCPNNVTATPTASPASAGPSATSQSISHPEAGNCPRALGRRGQLPRHHRRLRPPAGPAPAPAARARPPAPPPPAARTAPRGSADAGTPSPRPAPPPPPPPAPAPASPPDRPPTAPRPPPDPPPKTPPPATPRPPHLPHRRRHQIKPARDRLHQRPRLQPPHRLHPAPAAPPAPRPAANCPPAPSRKTGSPPPPPPAPPAASPAAPH